MILIDNRNYLRLRNRPLLEKLAVQEEKISNAIIEPSKKDELTLKVLLDDKMQYIHSKYDPKTETERLNKQKNIPEQQVDHVLFFGVGLGYQIKEMLKEHPDMKFSIYEPNIDILIKFLSHQNLKDLPADNLEQIFTTVNEEEIRTEIQRLHQQAGDSIFVYTLPIYEKLYETELSIVMETIKEQLQDKKSSLAVDVSFQKRWTINSIKNFPKVLQTPNILHHIDKKIFKDKPAIIVAAGPSLAEEFEDLRYIKENGLAYIFSVGSAINALIEHDIYPDAACTYDPTGQNQVVFQRLKERKITNIPLIFGSSVGFETLENYPGPMLHMITSQDTLSPHLLDISNGMSIVLDAPSIAVVTFQLLNVLECRQIILVGQNLAFQNNKRYAAGIEYEHVTNELSEAEKENVIIITDVYGNNIETSDGFNRMRRQLELYISASPQIEVINTTKGGAHIQGTTFMSLTEVINKKLLIKNEVMKDWYKVENKYDIGYIKKHLYKMNMHQVQCEEDFTNTVNELKKIELAVQKQQVHQLENRFTKFDKEFTKLRKNPFYQAIIEPMVRVQNKQLSEKSQKFRYESDLMRKGQMVIEAFGVFLLGSHAHFQFAQPYVKELQERFGEIIAEEN
ncbi:motility associated factor glycosyltransferase family protein [Metabacillus fastidiosus]|uniref:motility associated factor glycosyltransferase family protein n=1 Tax=Metabacillus fastidiosus TaxID=1458 RepID=UPI002DBCF9AE|nr:6-hydroxymethylpterin diphosphokinase MptE-like protein [Metabacillus fastidiosus]MEC2077894.1 DUF115 domain-containing protein [Metabacillus fastidiosus]